MSRRDLYAMGEPFGDSATQHKVGGGRIYGGGGSGGGSGSQTSTQVQDVPDWAKPYAKEGLGKAAALTDITQNPYQTYDQSRQAGFTDLQNQAFTGAQNAAPSAAMGTAANMAGTAGLGALNAGANFNPYQTGQFGGQTAQNYMNPYMQNVVDIQQREAQRTADIAGTGRNAQAVKSGAFGGSRQAIMDAEANRNLSTQMGDIQAQGLNQAYNQGQQQFNTEQQLREQSNQFGNSLGMQGFQTALTGAGQLSNIGQQTFGQEMDINKLQQQYGTQQQAFDQQGKDNNYQDFLNQQRYPYQQLEFMNSMLRGTPMGTVQSMYAPPPSQLSQVAGLGATAYGISRMAEGGDVKGYAVGGGITGLLNDSQLQQRTQMPTVSTLGRMAAQDEMQDRAQMRSGSAQQAPQDGQPSVADEYLMSRGVASLPVGEMDFAGGGILAFAAGDVIPGPANPDPRRGANYPQYGRMPSPPMSAAERAEFERKKEMGGLGLAYEYLSNIGRDDGQVRRDAIGKEAASEEMTKPYNDSQRFANQAAANQPGVTGQAEQGAPPADTGGKTGQGGAGIGAPRAMGKDGFVDMFKAPSGTFDAMRTEQGNVNKAKEDVANKSRASLKKDQKEMGEYGTEREAKLKDQEAGLAGLEKRNQSMAFIEAGLAIMSGNSANAFENIGKGALVGTKAYKEGMDKIDTKRTKLDEAFMNLYDIRRGEKVANKKELRAAETAFESAKVDSAQAMASLTGEETKSNMANWTAGVNAYAKNLESTADNASRERIAASSNAATIAAAQYKANTLTEYQKSQLRNQAATEVDKMLAKNIQLQMQAAEDPSIRDGMIDKAYRERINAAGGDSGQGVPTGATIRRIDPATGKLATN
jgi:hypothetical protein